MVASRQSNDQKLAVGLRASVISSHRRSGRACHDYRDPHGVQHRVADRPQQHTGESTSAVAADDDKLGSCRPFDELPSRAIAHDNAAQCHVGVAFLPAR